MIEASIFMTNRSQAVRLPAEVRFDNDVKKIAVRILGNERILSPLNQSWDSFFLIVKPSVRTLWSKEK